MGKLELQTTGGGALGWHYVVLCDGKLTGIHIYLEHSDSLNKDDQMVAKIISLWNAVQEELRRTDGRRGPWCADAHPGP